jgi:hypothetical protein
MKVGEGVFIHIPKTAGTSISFWFKKNIHDVIFRNTVHVSLSNIKYSYDFSICVVRNPWDRIVSLWAFWNKLKKENIPFDFFVRNLHTYIFNEHAWFTFDTPQKAWVPNGVTYLLKFETLEDDFKVIQEKFNCFEPLPCVNTSEHDDYKKYYTQETWDIVSDVFKDDVEEFGYKNTFTL